MGVGVVVFRVVCCCLGEFDYVDGKHVLYL